MKDRIRLRVHMSTLELEDVILALCFFNATVIVLSTSL